LGKGKRKEQKEKVAKQHKNLKHNKKKITKSPIAIK
jgi:hypothetical protein